MLAINIAINLEILRMADFINDFVIASVNVGKFETQTTHCSMHNEEKFYCPFYLRMAA